MELSVSSKVKSHGKRIDIERVPAKVGASDPKYRRDNVGVATQVMFVGLQSVVDTHHDEVPS